MIFLGDSKLISECKIREGYIIAAMKEYACFALKILKNKPKIFFSKGRGGMPRAPGLGKDLIVWINDMYE